MGVAGLNARMAVPPQPSLAPARPSVDRGLTQPPPIVLAALQTSGEPLDTATRGVMASYFGHDFSQVRIHADATAARSAQAINALAYTVGSDVVFGPQQYSPGTAAGRRLLAHELTHVLQQRDALDEPARLSDTRPLDRESEREAQRFSTEALPARSPLVPLARAPRHIQRQDAADVTPDPTHKLLTDDAKSRIDGFLQDHKVSLLRDKNRAWLDGMSTTVDDVVAQVRREAHVLLADNDTIAAYIDSQFLRFPPFGPAQNRLGLSSTLPVLGPHLLPEDRQRILDFLKTGGFAVGPGLSPVFGGKPVALDDLFAQARALVLPIIPREEVVGVVSAEWSRLVMEALTHVPLPPPPPFNFTLPSPDPAAAENPDSQSTVGGQWTWHLNRAGSVERTVQVSFQRGSEAYQFGVNLDTGDVQALVGAQFQKETPTTKILGISLKAAAYLQLLGGITTARGEASGALTFQVQAGVQITATLGPVSVSVQLAPSVTLQAGKDPAVDFNATPQGGADKLAPGGFPPFMGIPFVQGRF